MDARSLTLGITLMALGCGSDCSEATCSSTLVIEVTSQTDFDDGEYEVLAVEDVTRACSFALTLGEPSVGNCDEGLSLDMTQFEQGYVLVRDQSAPATVRVEVRLDGIVLEQETFTPEYEDVTLADSCGPACQGARVSVAL